ncbi:hypothetical protein [Streptomyces sp. ST2-7A]|uniref:hypothetical protein n=1 Tax=Streptomyces sp. ST2-7A TaxID=2907214 RepID=UPI001F2FE5B2|nr:hypothetical protein [Streptomyces sp. ST2-7A]MCE7081557.1 hypothetical protein [Streptomyces sp. ST2-7A]
MNHTTRRRVFTTAPGLFIPGRPATGRLPVGGRPVVPAIVSGRPLTSDAAIVNTRPVTVNTDGMTSGAPLGVTAQPVPRPVGVPVIPVVAVNTLRDAGNAHRLAVNTTGRPTDPMTGRGVVA